MLVAITGGVSGRGRCGGGCGFRRSVVLVEGGDALRPVVVEDLEVRGCESVDRVAVAVGDDDVGEDDAGLGVESEGGLVVLRLCG